VADSDTKHMRIHAFLLSGVMMTFVSPSALAGHATMESVWSRENALERAMQRVPKGAQVTKQRCQEFSVGLAQFRYRCTVEWTEDQKSKPN
jgi:uncharacterized protein YcnI